MLSYLIHWFREVCAVRQLERQTEPMLMENQQQVLEYANYGLKDSALRASYLFHAMEISKVIRGCQHVIDLGCGPATQLCLVAQLNPEIQFTGYDLSPTMLEAARSTAESLELKNIKFAVDDITVLGSVQTQSVDAVISTVVVHHLPTESDLDRFFKTVHRVLKPLGAVYILDFSLLKRRRTIDFLVALNGEQPPLFTADYLHSLLAAFPLKVFSSLSKQYLPHTLIRSTFGVPFMTVVKTKSHGLELATLEKIGTEGSKLGPHSRSLLRALRFAFIRI